MKKSTVNFIEVVYDNELQTLEKKATEVVRRFYPSSPPVRLYRTKDGKIGCQLQITLAPGERKRLEEVYRAVVRVLGEKRGRRPGVRTVQTKLRLPETVYSALKKAATESGSTMSNVVADSLLARFQGANRVP